MIVILLVPDLEPIPRRVEPNERASLGSGLAVEQCLPLSAGPDPFGRRLDRGAAAPLPSAHLPSGILVYRRIQMIHRWSRVQPCFPACSLHSRRARSAVAWII